MQLALKDKEEMLVQKALERIRRAQLLGKKNVKLTQPELEALERKQKKDQALNDNRRSSGPNSRGDDRRRRSDQSSNIAKERKPIKRKSKGYFLAYDGESSSSSRRATPPGINVPGTGVVGFSPLGHNPPTQEWSSPSGSRSPSSHSLAQSSPLAPRPSKKRLSSAHEPPPLPLSRSSNLSRRLPDDADWMPRPRSASSVSGQSNPYDPYQYQTYSPPLAQIPFQDDHHSQGRRHVSSPQPERRYPFVRGEAQSHSSESSSLRREHFGRETPHESDSANGSMSDDDEGDGIQVPVVPYGQGYSISARSENISSERPRRSGR